MGVGKGGGANVAGGPHNFRVLGEAAMWMGRFSLPPPVATARRPSESESHTSMGGATLDGGDAASAGRIQRISIVGASETSND